MVITIFPHRSSITTNAILSLSIYFFPILRQMFAKHVPLCLIQADFLCRQLSPFMLSCRLLPYLLHRLHMLHLLHLLLIYVYYISCNGGKLKHAKQVPNVEYHADTLQQCNMLYEALFFTSTLAHHLFSHLVVCLSVCLHSIIQIVWMHMWHKL